MLSVYNIHISKMLKSNLIIIKKKKRIYWPKWSDDKSQLSPSLNEGTIGIHSIMVFVQIQLSISGKQFFDVIFVYLISTLYVGSDITCKIHYILGNRFFKDNIPVLIQTVFSSGLYFRTQYHGISIFSTWYFSICNAVLWYSRVPNAHLLNLPLL